LVLGVPKLLLPGLQVNWRRIMMTPEFAGFGAKRPEPVAALWNKVSAHGSGIR